MENKGKYKYLAKNIGLLTLSNFSTKLLSFFLVPLYTNVLSTVEYGIYDLFNTTIMILVPILTLDILDSVIRFAIDRKTDHSAILTVSFKYLLFSSLVVVGGLFVNNLFNINNVIAQYSGFFFLMYFTNALTGIITSYARGSDHIAELSFSSVICSFLTILFNIIFLLGTKWGLIGYFLANILAPIFQCIYLIIKLKMYKKIKLKEKFESVHKEMIDYSKPLIANSIAWWINNASDKYIVILFCGLAENGIYSVASKIPSILNILQTIFSQAWMLSAVKDFDVEDKNGFFRNTYAMYNAVMVIGCSGIILFNQILAKFLYAKEFYSAWKYVPWLTIAIVFGALSGYLGGFFSAVKNSKIFARSTILGAISNIVMNFILIPLIGPLGAALSTTLSYMIVWVIRLYHSKRIIRLRINLKRDIFTYALLIIQSVLLLITKEGISLYGIEAILFIVLLLCYYQEMMLVLKRLSKNK